jgi:S1-C subfamily serine protease
VYALPPVPREAMPPPRLGVRLELRDNAVTIAAIEKGSLAERSGLNVGDVVASVAGAPAASIARVTRAIRNTPAGTWLPMQVRRGTSTLEIIVKFPPAT